MIGSMTGDLRADCAQCFALCCVALPLTRSADFAIDKPAGAPCPKLDGFACSIHDRLPAAGFPGCAAYDCFGAGQRIAQRTFEGRDWRAHPELAESMFAAFATMRQLHELLWYLASALGWPQARPVHAALRSAQAQTERAAAGSTSELAGTDVHELRGTIAPLLRRASGLVRGVGGRDLSGADLTGTDLRAEQLRGADLRNARLLGADLRGADLGRADLLGADLRGADIRAADVSETLYLTQSQVGAARGDGATSIPADLRRPLHWTG
jgi:uncharacterized protein YjbI with pentapeptide repeats